MAQTPANSQLKPAVKPANGVSAPQARLILQDPLAFDQATQPSLRSSAELTIEPGAAGMERDKARDLWEAMSLEPEVAQERQAERKRLQLRADNLARESAAAKAQAIDLQAQLAKAQDERLSHPLVYAGAAGLVGVGVLWFMERRQRMAVQERELEMLAHQSPPLSFDESGRERIVPTFEDPHAYLPQQSSVFSLEDSPDLANDFATDLPGLPVPEPLPGMSAYGFASEPFVAPAPEQTAGESRQVKQSNQHATSEQSDNSAVSVSSTPDWAQPKNAGPREDDVLQDMSWGEKDHGLLAASKRVLGSMLRRRSQRDVLTTSASAHLHTEAQQSSHLSTGAPSTLVQEHIDDAKELLYAKQAQEASEKELLAQQLNTDLQAKHAPDQVEIELPPQIQAASQNGQSAMEHLLELRTAVNGLCALGRPEGAAKLLEEYIFADPSTCAWVYLEYMHLCEQIGWREEFETMRNSYRRQFNRMAPYWHEPNSNVLGLDGYARATGELCAAWAQGVSHSHDILASWLVGPLIGRKIVQLNAYHDLFDLYEMLEYVDTSDEGLATIDIGGAIPQQTQAPSALINFERLPVLTVDEGTEQEFVPTVSLLDLDYEFSSDVILEQSEVEQSEKAVTIVKTGNFSVDFNVAGTQLGALPSVPAELAKK